MISVKKSEVILSKINSLRAFRNLRVDPRDVPKFGITWKVQYYQDLVVDFGLIHGSSSFQLVNDVKVSKHLLTLMILS